MSEVPCANRMPAPSASSFYNLPKMENKIILVAMTKGLRGNVEYIKASLFTHRCHEKMIGKKVGNSNETPT